jgi:serine/threonine-protein kinase
VAFTSQDRIGPYRLLNIVKTGQTSQVWAVINDRDQKRLALKILLSDFRKDREHFAYMKQEALVGKPLDHPNVIKVYDYAVDQNTPYLAMEYFPAPNIKEILQTIRTEVAFLMPRIVESAAEGLSYFNQQGWVHRDVKPDNFLVNRKGFVKLIDFALAVRIKKKGFFSGFFGGKQKVQGTRSYMSPEQIRGEALDERSDVYSFGCTIFHLIAGRPPYTGANSNDLLTKHLKAPIPPLEAQDRNISPQFGEMIRSTMAKNPDKRPASMAMFLSEVRVTPMFRVAPEIPAGFEEGADTADVE